MLGCWPCGPCADCENAAFLRLLFGRIGKENAAGALLGLFHMLDDHSIASLEAALTVS